MGMIEVHAEVSIIIGLLLFGEYQNRSRLNCFERIICLIAYTSH